MSSDSSSGLGASVVIPTYNRPGQLATCLEHLRGQRVAPLEIVVVDSSPNDYTRAVVRGFPEVRYLRNERGAGTTATSRAIGVAETTGEIVAFLDDDAYAEPEWLAALLMPYADPLVGGVGGRARNGQPGEEREGAGRVGMLLPDGTLTGNFANDPGRVIDVDHLLGANMSLRRAALDEVGGIRDRYPGTCLREETDSALRLRAAGWHLRYNPEAVVSHVAGPYAKGKRFDLRYQYYAHRNHVVLLTGTGHLQRLPAYVRATVWGIGGDLRTRARATARDDRRSGARIRSIVGGIVRGAIALAGVAVGCVHATRYAVGDRSG